LSDKTDAAPRHVKVTRENILNGSLHELARSLLPDARFMTPRERARHLDQMLAAAPHPGAVWVFGCGSLMWNPAFHFAERRIARIHGWHRRYCLWSHAGRGSRERPGLMLALERGGSCVGVAYRIARAAVRTELDVVWRREMLTMAYRPVWVRAYTAKGGAWAIAFTANRSHERYVRSLGERAAVRYIATGGGHLGACRDYLFDTAAHLRELGIRDRRLEALERRVRGYLARRA
jgi:cation transport protein ChaC